MRTRGGLVGGMGGERARAWEWTPGWQHKGAATNWTAKSISTQQRYVSGTYQQTNSKRREKKRGRPLIKVWGIQSVQRGMRWMDRMDGAGGRAGHGGCLPPQQCCEALVRGQVGGRWQRGSGCRPCKNALGAKRGAARVAAAPSGRRRLLVRKLDHQPLAGAHLAAVEGVDGGGGLQDDRWQAAARRRR